MDHPVEIVGESAGPIRFSPALPSVYGGIPGIRCLEAKDTFGHLLIQETAGEGFSLWHYSFFLNKDDRLTLTCRRPILRLWLALKSSFYHQSDDTPEQALHERGFRIEYAPALRQTIRLRARQPYVCVAIHFTVDPFRELASCFEGVDEFLQAVEKQQRMQLTMGNWIAGTAMLNTVDDILYCRYTSEIRKKYLTCKAMELLFLALEQITDASMKEPVPLPEPIVRRIYEARQLITANLARGYSLKELSVLVGLSNYHLKKGFKAIYNLTVSDFRQEIRMQKARLLLEETDLPVARIAVDIGYEHPFAFSSAFKKFFGCSPSLVRKGGRMHTG